MAKSILLALTVLGLVGCEVKTSYLANPSGLPQKGIYWVVEGDDLDVYMTVSPSDDAPGITVVAYSKNQPVRDWEWEQFQTWSLEKQDQVYGAYYDKIFLEPTIRTSQLCPIRSERFDHRLDAREIDYGAWLRPGREWLFERAAKGVFLQIPIAECKLGVGDSVSLIILVENSIGEIEELAEIEVLIEKYDKTLDWFF